MDRFFKSRILFAILMVSLSIAQAYVVHFSQSLYTEMYQKKNPDSALMGDYWRYHQ